MDSFCPTAPFIPGLLEVKKSYSSIKVDPVDLVNGKVRIRNKYNFLNLGFVQGSWTLEENGKKIQGGDVPVGDLQPGMTKDVDPRFEAASDYARRGIFSDRQLRSGPR